MTLTVFLTFLEFGSPKGIAYVLRNTLVLISCKLDNLEGSYDQKQFLTFQVTLALTLTLGKNFDMEKIAYSSRNNLKVI